MLLAILLLFLKNEFFVINIIFSGFVYDFFFILLIILFASQLYRFKVFLSVFPIITFYPFGVLGSPIFFIVPTTFFTNCRVAVFFVSVPTKLIKRLFLLTFIANLLFDLFTLLFKFVPTTQELSCHV